MTHFKFMDPTRTMEWLTTVTVFYKHAKHDKYQPFHDKLPLKSGGGGRGHGNQFDKKLGYH